MITSNDIFWIAGLLEGERCFILGNMQKHHKTYKQPSISLIMTDKDIINRASKIFGTATRKGMLLPSGKTTWRTTVYGRRGIGWMQTIYVLMGQRRQEKIKSIIDYWKSAPGRNYKNYKWSVDGIRIKQSL